MIFFNNKINILKCYEELDQEVKSFVVNLGLKVIFKSTI